MIVVICRAVKVEVHTGLCSRWTSHCNTHVAAYRMSYMLLTCYICNVITVNCRAVKVHDRRVRKARAKQNMALARRLLANKPGYKLDHLIKERYVDMVQMLVNVLLVCVFLSCSSSSSRSAHAGKQSRMCMLDHLIVERHVVLVILFVSSPWHSAAAVEAAAVCILVC